MNKQRVTVDVGDVLPSASALGLTALIHLASTSSTMDEVHTMAAQGAPAGTLVVADQQKNGRGRSGQSWESAAGRGLWMTLLERPAVSDATGVLALRIGMAVADATQPFVDGPIRLKWPNDLFVVAKLAGILVEARWRDSAVDWVAIGVGINMQSPDRAVEASVVRADVNRATLLRALIPPMRFASACVGALSPPELARWYHRDIARDRRIISPVEGTVRGISADGGLMVEGKDAIVAPVYSGSLRFAPARPQDCRN